MNNNSSNGREFFNILMNKLPLKVEVLQKILENCQLYDVLRIINTNGMLQLDNIVIYKLCFMKYTVDYFVMKCSMIMSP